MIKLTNGKKTEFLMPQVYQMKELILKRNLMSLNPLNVIKNTEPQIVCVQSDLFELV